MIETLIGAALAYLALGVIVPRALRRDDLRRRAARAANLARSRGASARAARAGVWAAAILAWPRDVVRAIANRVDALR